MVGGAPLMVGAAALMCLPGRPWAPSSLSRLFPIGIFPGAATAPASLCLDWHLAWLLPPPCWLQFICLAFYQKEMALYVRKNLDRCGCCSCRWSYCCSCAALVLAHVPAAARRRAQGPFRVAAAWLNVGPPWL